MTIHQLVILAGVHPLSSIPVPLPLASAAAVFCGPHGAVTRLAQTRGVFRQTLSREAHAVADAIDPLRLQAAAARQRQQQSTQRPESRYQNEPNRYMGAINDARRIRDTGTPEPR